MKSLFVLFTSMATLSLSAQEFAFEMWHEGKMVLENGDTLQGSIKYDMQTDLVQIKINDSYETYTARKLLFFEIFDTTVKRYRKMYTLPYTTSGEYKAPVIFELLEEGKITLLCRESLEYRTISSSFYYSSYQRLVVVNKYFLLQENGSIVPFEGKRGDWLDLMGKRREEVQKFAKAYRLDFDEKYELSRIIAYYNSLFAR